MTQLVFELIQNAAEAARDSRNRRIRLSARQAGGPGRAILEVADSGPGMTPSVRRHCLQPSFADDAEGSGTAGWGMFLVHGILDQVGGSMQIESEPGRGTRIMLDLPASDPAERAPS